MLHTYLNLWEIAVTGTTTVPKIVDILIKKYTVYQDYFG